MRLYIYLFFTVLFLSLTNVSVKAEITINKLIFDDSKAYHLKMLDALPDAGKIEMGPNDAKHTIIEFFDYFCGYCKKMHPELINMVQSRGDLKVVFLQHPILNESSKVLAKMAIAATMQGKGFEFHHSLFSMEGSITNEKLLDSIKESKLDNDQLTIDMNSIEVEKILKLSSFLAGGSGARGTPSIFINEIFSPGYLPPDRIENMLQ